MSARRRLPAAPANAAGTLALVSLVAAVPILLGLVAAAGGAVTFASYSSAGGGDVSSSALERFDKWIHGHLQVHLEDLGCAFALRPPTARRSGCAADAAGPVPASAVAAETARLL